jgi:hypothetical protein
MALTLKEAINAQITAAVAAITYTVGTGLKSRIVAASIVNTEAATSYTCNVYKIPSGDSAGAANKIINTRTIQGGETYPCPELIGQILEAGDKLDADASITLKLNFIVSVVEV